MKCPVCKEPDLLMTERQQIEIDYCPNCRGVWLDRGELDRLLEKAQTEAASPVAPAPRQEYRQSPSGQDAYNQQKYGHDNHHRKHDDDHYKHQKPYKRKSLLSEIFDF